MVQRPLAGKKIVITRSKNQAHRTVQMIRSFGGEVIQLPMVEFRTIYNESKFMDFLRKLVNDQIDYVIFMSVNGVKSLVSIANRFRKKDMLLKSITNASIVAIGEETALCLNREGILADIIPKEFSSAGIVKELSTKNLRGKWIYIPRTSIADSYLADRLAERGAIVKQYYVYESRRPKPNGLKMLVNEMREKRIWGIVFTSPSIVESFLVSGSQYIEKNELLMHLSDVVIVAIGPVTKRALTKEGIHVDVIPKRFLSDDLVHAIVDCATGNYSKNVVRSA